MTSVQEQEEVIVSNVDSNNNNNNNNNNENKKVKIYACFVTGEPPTAQLRKEFGDYGDMLIKFLKEEDKSEKWLRFDVRKDEFPTDEQLKQISAIAITGSASDAHGDAPWIVKLRNLCNKLYTQKSHKMVGFCFGHQLLGIAVNGKSGRAKSGWEVGLRTLEFGSGMQKKFPQVYKRCTENSKLLDNEEEKFLNDDEEHTSHQDNRNNTKNNDNNSNSWMKLNVHEFHQDQVYELPSNATILASSKRCPIEMFEIDDVVLGIQGHPEFSKEFHQALIRASKSAGIEAIRKTALEEVITNQPNNEIFQDFMREWFKKNI